MKRLKSWDRIHYAGVLIAALPFHMFFIYSIQITGISTTTVIYFFINLVLFISMFKFMKYLYRETDKSVILRKMFLFEILPVILFFIFFVKGRDVSILSNDKPLTPLIEKNLLITDK